jgi:hypothetical protein
MKLKIGFFGSLAIAFIVLKLCKVVDWSWWAVLSPIWGIMLLSVILITVVELSEKKLKKHEEEKEANRRRNSNSKFERRLQEAMDASEKKRQA